MKNTNLVMLCAIALGLSGCGTTWVNLDNSIPKENKVKEATKKCQVDDRIYAINEDQKARGYAVSLSGAKGEARKQLLKINKEKKDKDYQIIYDCMEKEGLKKQK
ncbi:hypothetical protein FJR48_02170 [Sulfurimonas lithotrophica]|uniref:Lipoprotein n=1 Tax=Sulfurimonas lithotrophica TaxID=2590022 RepID=A0A5P8NYX0_9BACT|nr:hypothetical protein [Sulfurimonas lithotrophica]QFR48594.1 hypothetical protein FJR48_02170 [Sulfurimonas lithotrophica]